MDIYFVIGGLLGALLMIGVIYRANRIASFLGGMLLLCTIGTVQLIKDNISD